LCQLKCERNGNNIISIFNTEEKLSLYSNEYHIDFELAQISCQFDNVLLL